MYNNEHVFSDGVDTGMNNGGVTPELMKSFVDAYFGGELNEAHSGSVPSSKWGFPIRAKSSMENAQ